MARKWGIGIGVAAAIAIGMLAWLWAEREPAPQPQSSEVPSVAAAEPAAPAPSTDRRAPAPEPERVAVVEDAPREDWNERYLATDDFFAFVAAAAPAAIAGDARAQYLISQALLFCQVQLLGDHASRPYVARNALRMCERFHTAHPLDTFDLPAEAKDFRYWRDEALANGDPLAVLGDSIKVLGRYQAERDPATKEQLREQVLAGLRLVVESRDPEAIMAISVFVQQSTSREPWRTASWYVAACELGLDCSKSPPGIARECATSQMCAGIQTVTDMIQMFGYPNESYARGQDIAYKIKIGDWEGLQPHLELQD